MTAESVGGDREVVVLAGDLDASGHEVLDRVVAAVVSERQLDRARSDRQPEQLVAETDPEDRDLTEQAADRVDGVRHGRRVAGPVRQEHAIGPAGEDVGCGRRCRHHLDPGEAAEVAQDGALDAEVVGDDERPPATTLDHAVGVDSVDGVTIDCLDHVRPIGGDLGDEVDAIGAGLGARRVQQIGLADRSERARQRAGVADQPRQAAGVDATDGGHAGAAQHRTEVVLGAVIAVTAGEVAHDHAPAERSPRLVVGAVGPAVADVRIGERDDLPGVARVGDHLLVAAQHGVEHDLAGGDAPRRIGAQHLPLEHAPVGEHQRPLANRPAHRPHPRPVCLRSRLASYEADRTEGLCMFIRL